MSMLTRALFGRRTPRTPRPAAARPNRARLAAECLDDRVMLSVTPTLLADGTLRVVGNSANDSVRVAYPTVAGIADVSRINVFDFTTLGSWNYNASQVSRIEMVGNDGNDWLNNDTYKPAKFWGGNGTDRLDGGTGNDVFYGSTGGDTYLGSGGQDTLYRNGNRGYFADSNLTDHDLTVGLAPAGTRFTPDELRAQGDMTVSLEGDRLVFAGPSGSGFAMRSNWTGGGTSYKTTGAVTLETYYGDLTLPSVAGVSTAVNLYGSPVGDAGNFKNVSWGGIPVTGTTNPLNGILDQATGGIGLDINLPGLTWGIGLGSSVKQLDGDAPLNDGVPYFYAHLNTGFSVSYSTATVTAPNTYTGTFAFSPADGTVYGAVTGLPVVGDFGIAVSPSGTIPYNPDRVPTSLGDPDIFGHYYVRGAIDLSSAGVPIEVSGNLVLDLDANDDGNLIGMNSSNIATAVSQFFTGLTSPSGLRNNASAVVNDVAVGFNGGVALTVEVLSLDLGSASAWYKPGQVAFRARSSNPFEDIPVLEKIAGNSGTFDLQGYINWTPGSTTSPTWYFKGSTSQSSLGGLSASNLYLEAGNTILGGGGSRAGASIEGPMGAGRLNVNGTIGFDGSFSLHGQAFFSERIDWGTFHAGVDVVANVDIGWNNHTQTFYFGGSVYAGAWAELEGIGRAGINLRANLNITIIGGDFFFVAGGSVTAWFDPSVGGVYDISVGFVLTNDYLTLQIPGIDDPTFEW